MISAVITCIGVFEVADYESSIIFWKFEMVDPIWWLGTPGRLKNNLFRETQTRDSIKKQICIWDKTAS